MDEGLKKDRQAQAESDAEEPALAGKLYAWLFILYALGLAVIVIEYLASHANV
ncbi:MAG: hypothetical protein R6V10_13790 [bacterium]